MATIQVEKGNEGEFRVNVVEGGSRSAHVVTVKQDYYRKLTGGKVSPEELVRRSFEFLLAHEPKESILSRFELPVISRYFPDYEREIKKHLAP
ncbi:MAG: hypothetical protein ACE5IP_02325 [Terriglobia bacterium]